MTEEQKREVLNLDIKLPEGYYFSEVDFEKDPDTINSTWRYAKDGDEELTRWVLGLEKGVLGPIPNLIFSILEPNYETCLPQS